jgi:hypothetical protein
MGTAKKAIVLSIKGVSTMKPERRYAGSVGNTQHI